MVVVNENTWLRMKDQGQEEEFHARYENALQKARGNLGKKHPLFIGGEARAGREEFADVSPIDTRLVLGYFQKGSREDARAAIAAAWKAFETWKATHYSERVAIFRRIADVMSRMKFELAALQSLENGKNRLEAVADIDEAIDYLRYYAEEMEVSKGYQREMGHVLLGEKAHTMMKPYGVWGIIPPFNFPMAITVGMSAGAMLTGNTIVLKPASDTPFQALRFYEITMEEGLPKGVMNYLTGPGGTAGAELIENPQVSGIAFTGSWDVGFVSIRKFSSTEPKPFIAEMGGKNATIVTGEADLDKAAEGVMRAAFGFCGQKCSATSRVYVQEGVKDTFLEKLVAKTKAIQIGDPTQRDVFLGPVINEAAYKKYQQAIDVARRDGQILTGGKVVKEGNLQYGYYVQPTIVDGLPRNHMLFKEELFLPVLCVAAVSSLEEAIQEANNVEYGLTAGIFSQDQQEIDIFLSRMEAGVVYANRAEGATTGAVVGVQAFGGWKHSGATGKNAGGPYYLPQFMREQCQTTYTS